MKDSPFCYALSDLAKASKVVRAWQQFFSPERISALVLMGADHCQGFQMRSSFDTAYLNISLESKSAAEAIRAMAMPQFRDKQIIFQRSSVYDPGAYFRAPLNWFIPVVADACLSFSIREHITLAPTSFRLQHQKRKGMRWGRLYCTDYRMANRDWQVAEADFPEEFGREDMFARLLDMVKARQGEGCFRISFEPVFGELIAANAMTPYDEFCFEI